MKRLCLVFLSLFVFAAFISPAVYAGSSRGKSVYTNQITVDIGTENRSAESSSAGIKVPWMSTHTNSLSMWVGRRDEIKFILMEGEKSARDLALYFPDVSCGEVEVAGSGPEKFKQIIEVPDEAGLENGDGAVRVMAEVPKGMEPGSYVGEITVDDGCSGEKLGEFKTLVEVLERPIQDFGSPMQSVQEGGTLYRWYRTYPNSKVMIGGPFPYSQPDEDGLFYIKINTSEMNYTAGTLLNVSLGGAVEKNRETGKTGRMEFMVKVEPRSYSTEWEIGGSESSGGGIVGHLKAGKEKRFFIEYDTENVLRFTREESRSAGGGVGASLFSTELGPFEVDIIGGGASAQSSVFHGSCRKEKYGNCSGENRVSAAIYILSGAYTHLRPSGGKLLEALLKSSSGMEKEHRYSGVDIFCEGNANLIEVGAGLGDGPESEIAGFQVSGSGERKGSYEHREYLSRELETYSLKSESGLEGGISAEILGHEPLNFGSGKGSSSELIFRNHTGGNRTAGVYISSHRASDANKQDISEIYHLGEVRNEELYTDIMGGGERYIPLSARAWAGNLEESLYKRDSFNKTLKKSMGEDIDIELPLELNVLGGSLSVSRGISFGRRNEFVAGRFMIDNNRKLPLKKYPDVKTGPLKNLSSIISYSLEPLENSSIGTWEILTESVKDGELSFPTGSLETGGSGDFLIKTYSPAEYENINISSDYMGSLSASGFASGNITDISPLNESDVSGNISLDCNCSDGKSKIYWWNGSASSWRPLETDTSNGSARAEAPGPGSYVVGKDGKAPNIKYNFNRTYTGNVSLRLTVSDSGSGLNTSSINVTIDGKPVNFTYDRFTGELELVTELGTGNYTVKVEAEDNDGNRNTSEGELEVLEPSEIVSFNVSPKDGGLKLDWSGKAGSYPIERYLVFRDSMLISNTTSRNLRLDDGRSAVFGVYPVDGKGNIGRGDTQDFSWPKIIPKFKTDWDEGLRPRADENITFNASQTIMANGSVEMDIISYGWRFLRNGNMTAGKEGIAVNKAFENSGNYTVVLKVNGSEGRPFEKRKSIYVEEPAKAENETNISLQTPESEKAGESGSWVTYRILLRNRGNGKDLIVIDSVNCSWEWKLLLGGEEVSVPFPRNDIDKRILKPEEEEALELAVKIPDKSEGSEEVGISAFSFSNPSVRREAELIARIKSGKDSSSGGSGSPGGNLGPQGNLEEDALGEATEDTSDSPSGQDKINENETTSGGEDSPKEVNETEDLETETPAGQIISSGKEILLAGLLISIPAIAGAAFYLRKGEVGS